MTTTESTSPQKPNQDEGAKGTGTTPLPAVPAPSQQVPLQERKLLDFYRGEEGHRPRAIIGIALATLLLYGSHSLYEWLPVEFWHKALPGVGTLLGDEFTISGALLLAGGLAIAALVGIYKLLNYPKFVDFLIDTENELKKVSWASRNQVVTESIVVIVTVAVLMAYIFVVDQTLIFVKMRIPWASFMSRIF